VAEADLYPRFDLQGYIGISTISTGNIFDSGSRTWLLGLPVSWNIFSGGRLQARLAFEKSRAEAALLAYQETVLAAITEVESALAYAARHLEYRGALERAHEETVIAAKVVWKQYENGVADFQRVIDVQRQLLVVEDDLVQVNGSLMKTLIRLYRALGGGWSLHDDPLMQPDKNGEDFKR